MHSPDCDLTVVFCPDFQNYLRTQTGNNTTVNIIISTVDYLLRVQVRWFCIFINSVVKDWITYQGVYLSWRLQLHIVWLNTSKNVMLRNLIKICWFPYMLSSCDIYSGVNQWFLLVLFWKRCHWWAGTEEFFKGNKCGKAGFQYAHRVHPGMRRHCLCKRKWKDLFIHFYLNY